MAVYFLDESGFDTISPIPYAWQKRGERRELPAARSRHLSVLGCINHELDGQFELIEGHIDRHKVIGFIDRFVQQRKPDDPPCLMILDNASIHRSRDFQDRCLSWWAQGVVVAYLPPYSPELNHIELLWQKMKYEWLPLAAYESFASLKQALEDILQNFGSKYQINFV